MSAATAAADEVDPELERQWEERTRPAREAPRKNSLFLRKDYAAACPQQHVAYLKCLKDSKSWVPGSFNSCQDEWRAFSVCKQRAKAVNGPPPGQEPRPGTLTRLWKALQQEPLYIGAALSVQLYMEKFGLRSPPGSDSSSSSSSDASSNSSSSSSSTS